MRGFPGVWKLPLLRLPSRDGSPSLTLLSLFLSFIFCPTSFQRQWAAFLGAWCPLLAIRSCLCSLLSVQMFLRWICRRESGLPVLVLRQLSSSPLIQILKFINSKCALWLIHMWGDGIIHTNKSFFGSMILGCAVHFWRGFGWAGYQTRSQRTELKSWLYHGLTNTVSWANHFISQDLGFPTQSQVEAELDEVTPSSSTPSFFPSLTLKHFLYS